MKTKMWKKILSLALALVMALTLLPQGAWAAVAHDAPEWGAAVADAAEVAVARARRVFGANGPSPSTDSQVFLEIRNLDENNNMLATGLQLYPKDLVGGGAAADTELKGHATYDKSTNTLTLNNFKDNNKVLYTNKMGDDFKLNLVGDNELGAIEIWHGGYGGSLHITGEGTLTVNKNGDKSRGIWYYGISLQAEGASSQLTIDNTATVAVRGLNGAQAITVGNTNNANAIVIGGNTNGAVIHPEQIVKTVNTGDIYTSYLLYVKDGGYYGAFRANSDNTVYYSMYQLTGDPDNGFTGAAEVAGEQGLTAIPAGYAPVYTDYYDHTLVDGSGNPLSYVSITPTSQAATQPTIITGALDDAFLGVAYSATLSATPHTEGKTITWDVISGALPADLTLSTDGTINGTPTASGSYTFTVRASEADGGSISKPYTLTVAAPAITTAALPTGMMGQPYSATLTATPSGNGAITWAVTAGGLPAGLALNAATGVISGTPTANGTSAFTVTATEEGGGIASKEFTLTVAEAKSVTYLLNGGTAGDSAAYGEAFSVASGAVIALPAAPTKNDEKGALTFAGWKVTSGGQAQGYTYNAGNAFTVTEDVTFTAQWERELTVSYSGQVIGWVGLCGVKGGNSTSLWGEYCDTVQPSVRAAVPVWQMRDKSYDRLDLHATVDGEDSVIASYTPAVGEKVTQTTGAVELTTDGHTAYTVLNNVVVTGLTRETDYYLSSVVHDTASGNKNIYLYDSPILVSTDGTYTVELSGVKGSANYDKYDWSATNGNLILSDGKLTVTPTPISATATVTGTVTVNGGTRSGVTVTATQVVGGVSRSVSATTEYGGAYSLNLIPGTAATFTASYQGQQLSVTDVTDGATHNLVALSNLLTVTITPDTAGMTDAEKKLADDYLNRFVYGYGWGADFSAAYGGISRAGYVSGGGTASRTGSIGLDFISGTSGTLSVSTNIPGLMPETNNSVQLTASRASATFTPALIPGVVVKLSATRTANVFTVWYDGDGVYKGKSETFSVYGGSTAYGISSPTGAAGTYTVVLLPASYSGSIDNLAYNALPVNAELTHWSVTLTAGRVTDLGAYSLSAAASDNAVFVTKPGSTMTASAQSFASTDDLIAFTGHIGLDDGCRNGKLTVLYANMGNSAHWEAVSAIAKQLVIDGKSYPSPGSSVNGVYTFDLANENIPLPCDYTLYCTPSDIKWEMDVSLSANVTYDGGSDYKQMIGRAVVEKPGAYITTLSAYVCDERIAVEGTAKPNEAVTIYDNGAIAGTATADRYGDWTAIIDLNGTDARYVTAHRIHSVSAAGVMSDEMTVFHQPGGAQLTGFTMTYSSYGGGITSVNRTVNVGDAYIANTLGLSDVSFTATVKNPEQLEVLTDGFNSKVTVKVYTNDGQIRFVNATQTKTETVDGATIATFVADVGDVPALVSGADVIFRPTLTANRAEKVTHTATDAERQSYDESVKELIEAVNAKMTGKDGWTDITDVGDAISKLQTLGEEANWSVSFDENGTMSKTGALNTYNIADEYLSDFRAMADSYEAEGFHLKEYAMSATDTESTVDWLNRIASGKPNGRAAHYETTSFFTDQASFEAEKGKVAAITGNKEVATVDFRGGMTYTAFSLTDSTANGANGEGGSDGTYVVTFHFLTSGTGDNVSYVESVSATFSGDFTGYANGTLTSSNGARRLYTAGFPASDGYLVSVGYASLVLADSAADIRGAVYKVSSAIEAGVTWGGGAAAVLGFLEAAGGLAASGMGMLGSLAGFFLTIYNATTRVLQDCEMKKNLDRLRASPCYEKLMPAQKDDCDFYYNFFLADLISTALIEALLGIASGIIAYDGIMITLCSVAGGPIGFAIAGLILAIASIGFAYYASSITEELHNRVLQSYDRCYKITDEYIRATAAKYEDDECKKAKRDNSFPLTMGKDMGQTHDPSGVVYEGVLENPVEGATATLYYAVDNSNNLVKESNSNSASQLLVASGVRGMTPNDPVQTTGGDGMFQWFVPEGLWFVTAEKGGLTGDSSGDIAATVGANSFQAGSAIATRLLPVLPPQLNVNIPLVDNSVPYVTDVQYKTDGVYVTFSKYMVDTESGTDSVLNENNYTLMNGTSPVTITGVEPVEQGGTPENRGTPTSTYTRTVKLTTSEPLTVGSSVTLTVNNAKSYAGTAMASYASNGTVSIPAQLAAPTFSGTTSAGAAFNSSTVTALMNRGDGLTIQTTESGANIYYTTDGSTPTVDESGTPQGTTKRYTSPIAVSGSMTVKAIAVKIGYTASSVATAEITQRAVGTRSDGSPVSVNPTPTPTPTPTPAPTPSGTSDTDPGSSSVTIPVTGGAGTVNLNVTVSGGTATLAPISDADAAKAAGAGGEPVNVVMDLTKLGNQTETVRIPDASLDKLAAALEKHGGGDSLTVKTANGAVTFNERALAAVANAGSGGNTELTIRSNDPAKLNAAQKAALDGRDVAGAFSLGVKADGKDVGALGGGFLTARLPFTPQSGTDAPDYRVYRVDEDGGLTLVPSAVHDGVLTVRGSAPGELVVVREPYTGGFGDVAADAWYANAVAWGTANGITEGMGGGLFAPDAPCTRAQLITMFWRAAGSPQPKGTEHPFGDVEAGSWYETAVLWAYENGITNGVSAKRFGTNETCTRAQVVTTLCRMESGSAAGGAPFGDVPADAWYANAVAWAVEYGITNGKGAGVFEPNDPCTRAQILTMLYRDYTAAS